MNIKVSFKLIFTGLLLLISADIFGQLSPLGAQYFQNTYLVNPAMAGINRGLTLNLGYRNQWNNIPGAPKSASLTTDLRLDRVGLGLSYFQDKAGLINQSKIMATYAYHLPIIEDYENLHFGLSFGIQQEQLDTKAIVGSMNDLVAMGFNENEIRLDADFGMAYSIGGLTAEGSIKDLKQQFTGKGLSFSNFNTFYSAFSYLFELNDWNLTPKIAYHGIKDFKNKLDIGVNLMTGDQQIGLTSFYHSNNSFTFGVSYQYRGQLQLMTLYDTPTSTLSGNASGSFEIGVRFRILNKEDRNLGRFSY